jgi:hypothetical protein
MDSGQFRFLEIPLHPQRLAIDKRDRWLSGVQVDARL